jgi:hypothetical protein
MLIWASLPIPFVVLGSARVLIDVFVCYFFFDFDSPIMFISVVRGSPGVSYCLAFPALMLQPLYYLSLPSMSMYAFSSFSTILPHTWSIEKLFHCRAFRRTFFPGD